jgi:hypothetical protein
MIRHDKPLQLGYVDRPDSARTRHVANLATIRKSIFPDASDNWASIAARELPELNTEEAVGMLQSWNLHVFMRPAAPEGSSRAGNPILPSDVIFVEAPLAG